MPVAVPRQNPPLTAAHGGPAVVPVSAARADLWPVVDLADGRRQQGDDFFSAAALASPDLTVVCDLTSGSLTYCSPGRHVLGRSGEQLEQLGGSGRAALVHPEDRQQVRNADEQCSTLLDGEVQQLRYRMLHADGEWHWVLRRVTPLHRDASGALCAVLAVLRDVTDAVDAERRLHHAALHDPLTGLANRALLAHHLGTALSEGGRTAVLFCDLDGFKRVNDTAGNAVGDGVLREVARRVTAMTRDGDVVSRVGGDEFVLLTGLANEQAARALAARLNRALRRPVTVQGIDHVVTASIGIAFVAGPEHGQTVESVLQDAEAAMSRAKGQGKDRCELFEPVLRTDLAERGRVEHLLRRAFHPSSRSWRRSTVPAPQGAVPVLTAAYQPVVDTATGRLCSFEALARLDDTHGVAVPPVVFVGIAEETGLVGSLGALMLEKACSQLAAWRAELPAMAGVTMAVNISALQAQQETFWSSISRVLQRHGLAPSDLILELTETALLQAQPATMRALREIHEAGVGIAIDDFGTGYASLQYLMTLPVTSLKVDRSFTAGLPRDPASRTIVKAVAGLAADLDLDCVVEGVETQEQRTALPAGVQLQGWLTGRPTAPEAIKLPELLAMSFS